MQLTSIQETIERLPQGISFTRGMFKQDSTKNAFSVWFMDTRAWDKALKVENEPIEWRTADEILAQLLKAFESVETCKGCHDCLDLTNSTECMLCIGLKGLDKKQRQISKKYEINDFLPFSGEFEVVDNG